MRYAIVVNGLVENIIEADYQGAQQIADAKNSTAIEIEGIPVCIGMAYDGADFYTTDGLKVEKVKTDTERLAELEQLVADLASLQLGV